MFRLWSGCNTDSSSFMGQMMSTHAKRDLLVACNTRHSLGGILLLRLFPKIAKAGAFKTEKYLMDRFAKLRFVRCLQISMFDPKQVSQNLSLFTLAKWWYRQKHSYKKSLPSSIDCHNNVASMYDKELRDHDYRVHGSAL